MAKMTDTRVVETFTVHCHRTMVNRLVILGNMPLTPTSAEPIELDDNDVRS